MSTMTINLLGLDIEVDYYYYRGTNHTIHSASLETNDPEVFEIEDTRIVSDLSQISDSPEDLEEYLLEGLHDSVAELAYQEVKYSC